MQRFYLDLELWGTLLIDEKWFFGQVSVVLRSRIWDQIILFNWDWTDYVYVITSISKKWIWLEYKSGILNNSDSKLHITLFQALPNKFEKIDYILQKWTEVGILEFVFFRAERSSKLVISENKLTRFHSVVKEALEQCWWNIMPTISIIDKLEPCLIKDRTYLCHTKWTKTINENISSWNIGIIVWPEWWFSDKEISDFEKIGNIEFINFWERILRTETMSWVLAFKLIHSWL